MASRDTTSTLSVSPLARFLSGRALGLSVAVRYGVAVGAAAAAIVLRLALNPIFGTTLPFITFYPAVVVIAWLAGFWPGVMTTLLFAAAVDYFWMDPTASFAIDRVGDSIGLLIFVVMGVTISGLNEAWRRASAAIGRSEEGLRVTLASIGDGVITTDHEGRVSQLNAVAQGLTGWTEAEAAGQPLEDVFAIVNEKSRRPVESLALRVLREGTVVGLANHTILLSRDGREIPVDDSAAPIRAADGTVTGVVIVFRDVTARRREEREREALLQAERDARIQAQAADRRLRFALQAGRMETWQWTIRTGKVARSDGFEALHGDAPGTFAGTIEAFQQEIHPADRDRVLGVLTEAIAERRDYVVDYRIVRTDGAVRWVEGRGQLFTDADGQPDRMVGVCSDITERKHAEERFRLAVEAAPSGMIMVDRRGIIQHINVLAEQLFGYARDEIIGQSIERLVPARFRGGHAEYRTLFFMDPTQRPMGSGRDLYALRKDGSEVPVEIGLSPIETVDGPIVLAAITDITERKRSAVLLQGAVDAERAAKREAQYANQLKDQFLAMVSHELRTPLNAVLGWAEVLRTGVLDDTRRQRALDAVYVNAKRQAQLIDDLLDATSIISGRMRVQRTAVDLHSVVRSALDVIQLSADAKRIHVETATAESIGTVLGDAARLQQILWNLLANGVKFTPEGGAIHVSVHQSDSVVEIAVTDNGKGIGADFLPRVFEPFQQADGSTTRTHGGLGLGLAIVKHLVEAHGGTVSAHSAGEGHGSTFTVRLPIVAVYSEEPEASRSSSGPAGHVGGPVRSIEGVTVLVVDDDADSRDLLTACLEVSGASALTAASAAEAIKMLQRERVDVLLADIAMPGEDGYALIRQVRALESPLASTVPAAALSSLTHEDDKQRALHAGFQLHLGKPIESRVLVEAVASLMIRIASHELHE